MDEGIVHGGHGERSRYTSKVPHQCRASSAKLIEDGERARASWASVTPDGLHTSQICARHEIT